jgi:hypothetical protein
MKTIKIISRHETLADAVKESGMDLSYNPAEARRKINDIDNRSPDTKVEEAFVTSEGKVLYIFKCDIRLLNEFDPFMGVLHDGPFYPVAITSSEPNGVLMLHIDRNLPLSRDKFSRRKIGRGGLLVTTL